MSKYINADALTEYLDELRRDVTEPQYIPQAAKSPAMAQIEAYDNIKRIVEQMPAVNKPKERTSAEVARIYAFRLQGGGGGTGRDFIIVPFPPTHKEITAMENAMREQYGFEAVCITNIIPLAREEG